MLALLSCSISFLWLQSVLALGTTSGLSLVLDDVQLPLISRSLSSVFALRYDCGSFRLSVLVLSDALIVVAPVCGSTAYGF